MHLSPLLAASTYGLLLLSLASPASAFGERIKSLRANQSTAASSGVQEVPYGPDPAQRYDRYLPASPKPGAPTIFMVHGGAWRIGDKRHAAVIDNKLQHWLAQGSSLISVNYPMLPNTDPLEQARHVARALAHAQQHAASPERFVLMGHSAGAHLVALLNSAPELAHNEGTRPWLGVILLDSAALDLPEIMNKPHLAFYDTAFGHDPEYWQQTSPTQRLRSAIAPTLLICSTRRADACPQAESYQAKARENGSRASLIRLDLSHSEINAELGKPGAYTSQVDAFLNSL